MGSENLIVITGLEGNDPATLTPLQSAISPFVPDIMIIWWSLWMYMLAYMFVRFLIVPLFKK